MKAVRNTVLVIAAVFVLALRFGYATSLNQASHTLGTNGATVARCDTSGVTIIQNLSGSNVVSVTVGSISSVCEAGTLSVTVNNGSSNSSGSATVPGGGGSMTVSLGSSVPFDDDEEIDVSISGP